MVELRSVNLAVTLRLATMEESVELQVHNIKYNCCLCCFRRLLNGSKSIYKQETQLNLGNAHYEAGCNNRKNYQILNLKWYP